MRPEDSIAEQGRPYTGHEYIQSLRDDRAVYIDGERVDDVTTHPMLRNSVRSIARLYDALHDPLQRGELTCATGEGGYTHRSFQLPRNRDDLMATQRAIAGWARLTYGWMGRTPDYKAAFTNTLGANPEFYGPYTDNARRWYALAQRTVPFMNHAIVNPPIDRHLPADHVKDVYVRVTRETSAGIVVSGAKVVATSAAMTHYTFIGQTGAGVPDDPAMNTSFIIPVSAPGVKMFCRTSYEHIASSCGSPFDYPLSSRFDENDAILVLDNVLVPWENVLIYRDAHRIRSFFTGSGFLNGFLFQGCTRLAVKLDFMCGLLAKALRCTGGDEHRSNTALLGELIAMSHTMWSLSSAMASNPDPWTNGAVLPERRAALAYNVLAPDLYPRMREIVMRTIGSGLIYLPSSSKDLTNPDIAPALATYVRGSHGIGHEERIKIMKLLWDAVGTEFAGRHELYERNYAGSWEGVRLQVAAEAQRTGRLDAMGELVDRCMAEYDVEGWTGDTWHQHGGRTDNRTAAPTSGRTPTVVNDLPSEASSRTRPACPPRIPSSPSGISPPVSAPISAR